MNLAAQIQDHRHLYRQDLHIGRLVARQPPTSLDLNTGELHQEPAAANGMNMSGRLLRRLSHPQGYGTDFPWQQGYYWLRHECRHEHPDHYGKHRPYWRQSLCQQAVKLVVIGPDDPFAWTRYSSGLEPEHAGAILKIDRIDDILRWSFRFIEAHIDKVRAKAERRERELQGHGPGALAPPPWEHRPLDGLHAQECPQCRAKLDAA